MTELKYVKLLPCKFLNNNKTFISLKGSELYIDSEGNKYVYLSFDNHRAKPFFSLHLSVGEYDEAGVELKEIRFDLPSVYATNGTYVIETPIKVEKECEAISVMIKHADFTDFVFENDKLVKTAKKDIPMVNSTCVEPGSYLADIVKRSKGNKEYIHGFSVYSVIDNGEETNSIPSTFKPTDTDKPTVDTEKPTVEVNKEKTTSEKVLGKANTFGIKFNFAPIIAIVVGVVIAILALVYIINLTTDIFNSQQNAQCILPFVFKFLGK